MNNIYVVRGSEQAGPFTEADIRAQLASGAITPDSLVWWDGLPEWTALAKTPLAPVAAPATPVFAPAPVASAPVVTTPLAPAPAPVGTFAAPAVNPSSKMALISLITGIAGFFCGLSAIAAVITGHMARKELKTNPGMAGGGMALTGLILGYIVIALMVVGFVFYVAVIGMAVSQSVKDQANQPATTNSAPANP